MSTKNEIANMAVAHLGIGKPISDIATDTSTEAKTLNRFYNPARIMVLRDFNWPFARKIASLGVAATNPVDNWAYSYAYPSDCIKFYRIWDQTRYTEAADTRIDYKIVHDSGATKIYTNEADAIGEYTVDITDESLFEEDFALALSYRLAIYIAPVITGGDMGLMVQNVERMYQYHMGLARQNAANESGKQREPESALVRARGGGYYPWGYPYDGGW